MTPSTYALRLSDDELGRYRMMAARARAEEGDLWDRARIVPGSGVADVGCGPGAMLVALAEVVGPTGRVTGIDADPAAVGAALGVGLPRHVGRRLEVRPADDLDLERGDADRGVLGGVGHVFSGAG